MHGSFWAVVFSGGEHFSGEAFGAELCLREAGVGCRAPSLETCEPSSVNVSLCVKRTEGFGSGESSWGAESRGVAGLLPC